MKKRDLVYFIVFRFLSFRIQQIFKTTHYNKICDNRFRQYPTERRTYVKITEKSLILGKNITQQTFIFLGKWTQYLISIYRYNLVIHEVLEYNLQQVLRERKFYLQMTSWLILMSTEGFFSQECLLTGWKSSEPTNVSFPFESGLSSWVHFVETCLE